MDEHCPSSPISQGKLSVCHKSREAHVERGNEEENKALIRRGDKLRDVKALRCKSFNALYRGRRIKTWPTVAESD